VPPRCPADAHSAPLGGGEWSPGGAVGRQLDAGRHYAEISRDTGASTATITRIASWLNHGEGGYRLLLERLADKSGKRRPYPVGNER